MNDKKLLSISNKLDKLISNIQNDQLDMFLKNKNEFCSMILYENNNDFNEDIKDDIIKIIPNNLTDSFKNFIKFIRILKNVKNNDNDYTKYILDNMIYIRKEIFKDY